MGIYIKGLKAPASCCKCRLSRWSNYGQCYMCNICEKPVAKLSSVYESTKPDWCPIIGIPEHGDLIDRDALNIGEYEREDDDTGTLEISLGGLLDLYHKVKDATTIIEAEGGENE